MFFSEKRIIIVVVLFLGTTVALIILALGFLLSAQVSPRVTFRPTTPSDQNTTCTGYR
jgi:SP family myo-inositol transporter-like MFS transporter 13